MSPHSYLVYFLICVEWSICYEYYDRNLNDKRDTKKNSKVKHNRERNLKILKDSNPQFDLAGFLNLDEVADSDETVDYGEKSAHHSKDYIDYGSLIDSSLDNSNKIHYSPHFGIYNQAKSNINPLDFNNLGSDEQYNLAGLNINEKSVRSPDNKAVTSKYLDEPMVDASVIHNPEKKCSFRKMKIPFFSRNKSQSTKKAKKRKMFCLNCKKEDSTTTTGRSYEMNNKFKRSYMEKLCPECLKRFRTEFKEDLEAEKRKINQRMVHNSRQYFAERDNLAKAKFELDNLLIKNPVETFTDVAMPVENKRRKRDDDEFDVKDKLKELEQVQRKVDSVKIIMPHFDKPIEI